MPSKLATVVMLFAMTIAAGCSTTAGSAGHTFVSETNLIFNPERMGLPPAEVGRTDWPSTMARSHPGEDLHYQETIIDRQGWSPRNADRNYYRRFTAIRTGRARR